MTAVVVWSETFEGKRASTARWPWRSGGLAKEKTAPLPARRLSGAESVSSNGAVAHDGGPPGPATGRADRLTVAIVPVAGALGPTATRSIEWPRTPPLWLSRLT